MFSLQSNEKVSRYANFLQTKCMKKRLTRYFYDFKVAKGTVIYGESNKSANLMPSLQACGSALFGIESYWCPGKSAEGATDYRRGCQPPGQLH